MVIGEYEKPYEDTDKIVPNDDLSKGKNYLKENYESYQFLFEYIEKEFNPEEKKVSLSRVRKIYFEGSFIPISYTSALIKDVKIIALKATTEKYSYYFLSNYFLNHLKERNLSIAHFEFGESVGRYIIPARGVDTREKEFHSKEKDIKQKKITFFHKKKMDEREISDIVTNTENLIGIKDRYYSLDVEAIVGDWRFMIDYLKENFSTGKIPFGLTTIEECYWMGDDIIAGVRKEAKEIQIFLTKEGYKYLKEKNLAIVRQIIYGEGRENLELLYCPEERIWISG